MPSVENDHMVEQIAAAVSDPTLGNTVLPGASEASSLGLNPEALDRRKYLFIEIRPTIKDQLGERGIKRECLAQLLRHPCTGRVSGHIEVQNAPPIMGDDEEAVQCAEGKRRRGEEIHRGYCFTMVVQKRRPSLCRLRISGHSSHLAQSRPLRDIETEHLQLAMNARRAPGAIFGDNAEDELTQFPVHAFSTCTLAMPG